MTPIDTPLQALEEAVDRADGVTNLATRIGVAQSTVSMWLARSKNVSGWAVPAENCPAIERETGVRCERLNPRADWAVLRLQTGEWDGAERRTQPTNP